MRGIKQSNEYAQLLNNYDQIPKSVLAAIAISALTCGGDHLEKANEAIHEEWTALYDAQIVPQKPIKPEAK